MKSSNFTKIQSNSKTIMSFKKIWLDSAKPQQIENKHWKSWAFSGQSNENDKSTKWNETKCMNLIADIEKIQKI